MSQDQAQDFKIKPMVKKVKGHRIQKLIRNIRILERKRGTEKQIEKNKRRATRLQKEVKALRKVDLEQICSEFSGLTGPPSTDAIKQALSGAITSAEDSSNGHSESQSVVDLQYSEDDFFITNDTIVTTTTCTSRANDVRHKNDKRKPVSCHSSKHLPLNSLFLHSLGDDSGCYSASLGTKNRKGQRARQRMWELKYGREAKHLKKATAKDTTSNATRATGSRGKVAATCDQIHPSWMASKRLKQKAHSIKQFQGTHTIFSDS